MKKVVKKVEVEVEFPTENIFPDYVQESKRLESFRSWPDGQHSE
jgi:hypothetical protein